MRLIFKNLLSYSKLVGFSVKIVMVFNSRTLNLIRDRCVVVCGFLFDISDELYADLHRSQFLDEQLASVWNSDLDYISFA